jgi:hypothetical protein
MIRSQGVRDVALGVGALRALVRGDERELRAWIAGYAVSDSVDFATTWSAREHLPKRRARVSMAIALRLGRRRRGGCGLSSPRRLVGCDPGVNSPARPVSVGGGGDPVAVLGAAGGAVVQAEFDLALSSQLGEVALGGGAADSDLFGDVRGRDVVG